MATALVVGLLGGCAVGPLGAFDGQQQRRQQGSTGEGGFDPNRLPFQARQYVQWIVKAGRLCDGVTPEIVAGIIQAESTWRPLLNKGSKDKKVALGIAQFTEESWGEHGTDADGNGKADIFSPADAIVSAGYYLCFIRDKVREYIRDEKIPGLQGNGNVRDLMIVGYNKGPYIWTLTEWNGKPIHFDSAGIPDAEDGNGTNGREYLEMVDKAIKSFRSPGSGAAATTGARATMKQAALAEVGTHEDKSRGKDCQKYNPTCDLWCAMFVSWVWDKGGFTFSSPRVVDFRDNGNVQKDFSKALPGDAVIFLDPSQGISHIGIIVEAYEDGQIGTVEGNSGPNVDQVAYHAKFNPAGRGSIGYVAPMNKK